MVKHTERIKAFVKLGSFFRDFLEGENAKGPWEVRLQEAIERASTENGWFTRQNIRRALGYWGEALREDNVHRWLSPYSLEKNRPKTVAVIMAGNIPLVGFHDFISVLVTGNRVLCKLSSNDQVLLPLLAEWLQSEAPNLKDDICFAKGPLKDYQAVIATGSDNTARYFHYYFGDHPNIIRNNRNSAAVLGGRESFHELQALGTDIFTYFGLGCRNVSKLYVPETYDFDAFYKAIEGFSDILSHRKYHNNYDYNKAVFLMSGFPFLDNGFLLLKEDTAYGSPIGCLYYERYGSESGLKRRLEKDAGQIQCVVGRDSGGARIPFGTTQQPALWEYADQVDTVDFLLKT